MGPADEDVIAPSWCKLSAVLLGSVPEHRLPKFCNPLQRLLPMEFLISSQTISADGVMGQ